MSRPCPKNDGSVIAEVILSTVKIKYKPNPKVCVIIRKTMSNIILMSSISIVVGKYSRQLELLSSKSELKSMISM